MMKIGVYSCVLFVLAIVSNSKGQPQISSNSFEIRYYTSDSAANGETDFKGETEWLSLNSRVAFLQNYADYAAKYFGDPALNKPVIQNSEVQQGLEQWKPQPTTSVRRTVSLSGWKSIGYREGQDEVTAKKLRKWQSINGATVVDGKLELSDTEVNQKIDTINWRFKIEFNAELQPESKLDISLTDKQESITTIQLQRGLVKVGGKGKRVSDGSR